MFNVWYYVKNVNVIIMGIRRRWCNLKESI